MTFFFKIIIVRISVVCSPVAITHILYTLCVPPGRAVINII
jgi:hypothetical protein